MGGDPARAPRAAGLEGLAEPESLLRHVSEVLLDRLLRRLPLPATLQKKFQGTLLDACLAPVPAASPWLTPGTGLDHYRQWANGASASWAAGATPLSHSASG